MARAAPARSIGLAAAAVHACRTGALEGEHTLATTHAFSANVFTLLAGATALFQLALVGGAPWGHLTQGGRVAGTLPLPGRAIALVSAALLVGFIVAVRRRARAGGLRRTTWAVVAYCALGVVANAATRSAAERALWLPVVAILFGTSLHVARRREPRGAA